MRNKTQNSYLRPLVLVALPLVQPRPVLHPGGGDGIVLRRAALAPDVRAVRGEGVLLADVDLKERGGIFTNGNFNSFVKKYIEAGKPRQTWKQEL